ncbi:uncharacterized protein BCR38DRAFT_437672 [Pseudomassariella vexata]|uniref:Uncharacterized protein n=1 Tax=Pseudomassariella vexata TaxID=1141098 RepID=A0A1Y2DSA3_9PEZI|nr:uncharacterized protein BCR38DRAFT_437672 [Pseudomassariella vexata]ORY62152.1 hypothetical protein BCR38DRAFT_437672 [Pseudomassariella vexata]
MRSSKARCTMHCFQRFQGLPPACNLGVSQTLPHSLTERFFHEEHISLHIDWIYTHAERCRIMSPNFV